MPARTRKVKRPIHVGIIGTGIGQAHFAGYSKLPNVKVIGLVDIIPERAKAVAAQWNVPHAFTDCRSLLELEDLDAVSVGVPNSLHLPIAVDALAAGKHVLCEKPMAATLAQAEELAAAAAKSDRIFMMAMNNRYRGDTQLLKKYIEAGDLGDLYFGRCGWVRRRGAPGLGSWFTTKVTSGGGPLIDIGVHALDLCWWLMGKPKPLAVSGSVFDHLRAAEWRRVGKPGTYDVEDAAVAHIRFANGAAIMLEASWLLHTPAESFYCHVMGTKGGAAAEPDLKVVTERFGELLNLVPTAPRISGHDAEVAHFVDCIATGKTPLSTAEDGLAVQRMLDAVYRSGASGKAVAV